MRALLLVFIAAFVIGSLAIECGPGELICNDARLGDRCYRPDNYTCPRGSRGTILCGNQEHGPDGACGYICYDMVDYICCNEQLYNAHDNSAPCAPSNTPPATIPPPSDSIMCGGQRCLALYECCNDTRMGPSCFDPNGASCPIGSQGPVLCGFQKNGPDAACGTTCYDFHEYQCCNDRVYGINETTPCSTGVTTAPTQIPTSVPTNAPTTAQPTRAPTPVPTETSTTLPTSAGTIAPPPNSIMCGGQRCLALYECCNDTRLGPSCFDPNGASCPIGSKGPVLCGFQKNGPDAACGTTCYDFHEYQCCDDKLYGINENTPCSSGVTSAPTLSPTTAPTQAPTQVAPTRAPTQAVSTQAPTQAPTAATTTAPTLAPTSTPTKAPTAAPTERPTSPATNKPTTTATTTPSPSPTSVTSRPTTRVTITPTTSLPTVTSKATARPSPTNPNNPSGPDGNNNPSGPNGNNNPSGPNGGSNPSGPNNGSQNSNPSGTSQPSGPNNPSNPSGPNNPSYPNNPSHQNNPSNPHN